jgi:NAD(P)-dependent dehydrogenase (short-subunit alcohol dehydrogenase family)
MAHTAVVTGVGSGLGAALVRKLASEGCRVGMFARSTGATSALGSELSGGPGEALALAVDITDETAVAEGFGRVREAFGPVTLLIHNAGNATWKDLDKLTAADVEAAWRVGVLGGFLCAREAAADMREAGGGAILFTGASSSVRGRAGAVAFSSAKFAVRGMAWSLARELWPQGIHVAHVVVDGLIDTPHSRAKGNIKPGEPALKPEAMADAYWALTRQDPSAWSFEIDLRPNGEAFFE